MPGKVNPVVPESVTMIAAQVIGQRRPSPSPASREISSSTSIAAGVAYNIVQSLELIGISEPQLAEHAMRGSHGDERPGCARRST